MLAIWASFYTKCPSDLIGRSPSQRSIMESKIDSGLGKRKLTPRCRARECKVDDRGGGQAHGDEAHHARRQGQDEEPRQLRRPAPEPLAEVRSCAPSARRYSPTSREQQPEVLAETPRSPGTSRRAEALQPCWPTGGTAGGGCWRTSSAARPHGGDEVGGAARSIAPLTHSLAPRCHARRPDQHDGAGGATRRGQHADHMGAEPGYGEDEDGGAGDPEEAELQAPGEEDALPQGRGQGDRAAEAPRGVSLKLAKAGRIVRANLRRPRVTVAVHFFSTNPLTASSLKTAVFLRVYGN